MGLGGCSVCKNSNHRVCVSVWKGKWVKADGEMKADKIVAIICISATLFCSSCSPVMQGVDSGPITAILGAFENEVILLEGRLTDANEYTIEGIRFASGTLSGQRVVIAWTGVGKVNAAMTTTLLIEHFKPNRVIFTGIAGSANPELHPGDIVIAEKTAHHDMGTLWPDGLYRRGVKNRLTSWDNPVFFAADEQLLHLTQRAAKQLKLASLEAGVAERVPKVITGVVVTGDVFVASSEKCAELRKNLGADAVEMEGAAVAQICYQRQIPHIVIRSISDKADEGAVQDKQMFYIIAAKNSANLVAELLTLLASDICSDETGQ